MADDVPCAPPAQSSRAPPARPSCAPPARLAFVFVCQAGEWELKAALLAASLRTQYGDGAELIAAIPHPREIWGTMADDTAALLDRLHVRCVPITNPIDPAFSHANKIACLGVETAADVLIFLDSDTLCLAPCPFTLPSGTPIAMKVGDLPAFPFDGEAGWARVYEALGRQTPQRRVALSCDNSLSPPFYNSGVIVLAPHSQPSWGRSGPKPAG